MLFNSDSINDVPVYIMTILDQMEHCNWVVSI